MADNSTFITGAADGAFTAALSDLPPWATESTAYKIQAVLEKTLNLQTKTFADLVKKLNSSAPTGNSSSPEDTKKANDELDKFVRNLKKINDEQPKEKKRWKDKEDQHTKDKKWWQTEASGRYAASISLTKFAQGIEQAFVSSAKTFDDLYRSGFNLMSGFDSATTGFEALQQIATLTGVRYSELAQTLVKYNTAVNAFGLGRFTKTMASASKDLGQFGYTTKETADLLGAYLESQKGYADSRSKTDAQVQGDLVKFGERVTRLSQATGVLRSKLLEDIDAISQSVEANILAGQVGNDAAQSTLEFVASFKDKNLGQAFLRMMTDSIKPLNETFMDFQKTGFGGFGQELSNFAQSLEGLDPAEAAKRTSEFANAHSQEMAMMVQRGNLLRQAGVKEADGMLKVVTGLQQQARAYKEMTPQQKKQADATAKATSDIRNAYEKFLAQFEITFAATLPILNMFTSILTGINSSLDGVRAGIKIFEDWLNSFAIISKTFGKIDLTNWIGLGIVVASLYKGFTWILKPIQILGNLFTSLAGGTANIVKFAATASESVGVIGTVLGTLGKIFTRFLGPIGLLYAAFELGQSIGEAIYENLSQLQGFNDAMDSIFSTIEKSWDWIGDKLSSAGSWIYDKIAAVGQFFSDAGSHIVDSLKSAGSFISDSFKNIFGSLGNEILNLFPWIKTLGDYISGFVGSVKSIYTAISDFGDAFGYEMKDFLSRVLSKFVDKMIPDFAKSWFSDSKSEQKSAPVAPASSAASAGTAGETKVEHTKVSIIKNPVPSTLNSPSQVSTKPSVNSEQATAKDPSKPLGAGIEKPVADSGINTMLGYQNSLLEQLLLSTNSLVSTNKDILKYTRAHT